MLRRLDAAIRLPLALRVEDSCHSRTSVHFSAEVKDTTLCGHDEPAKRRHVPRRGRDKARYQHTVCINTVETVKATRESPLRHRGGCRDREMLGLCEGRVLGSSNLGGEWGDTLSLEAVLMA